MLGLDEVPVTVADGLTDDEIRELRIADNKTNESEWDLDALRIDVGELNFDGFDFDFDVSDDAVENKYETENEETNSVDSLPQSRIVGFSVSAFGTNSQCFVVTELDEEQSEKLLEYIDKNGTDAVAEKIKDVLLCLT